MRRPRVVAAISFLSVPAAIGLFAVWHHTRSYTPPSSNPIIIPESTSTTLPGHTAPLQPVSSPIIVEGPIMSGLTGNCIDNPQAFAEEIHTWEESRLKYPAEIFPDEQGSIQVRSRPDLGLIEIEITHQQVLESGEGGKGRALKAIFHLRPEEYAEAVYTKENNSVSLRQALEPFSKNPDEFMAATTLPNFMVTVYKDGQESHTMYYWQLPESEEAKADPASPSMAAIYKNGKIVMINRAGEKAIIEPAPELMPPGSLQYHRQLIRQYC